QGSGVGQDSCYLIEEGIETKYNATDMKKRVLQLLNFKESSHPRSHSVIYRYAVFTPQEAMKEVLGQRPKERKETLRKAFGIEEYNTAAENTTHLVSDINIDMQVLKQSEKEIETLEENIQTEKDQITKLEEENKQIDTQIQQLSESQTKLAEQLTAKKKEATEYNDLKIDLGIQESSKNLNKDTLEKEQVRLGEITRKLEQSIEAEKNLKKLLPDFEKLLENRAERKKLEPKKEKYVKASRKAELENQKIESEKQNLNSKIEENNEAKKRLETQVNETEKELEKLPEMMERASGYQKKLEELPKLREKYTGITGKISEKKQAQKTTDENTTRLTAEWSEIESIGLGAECPRCQQELTEKHYVLLEKKYEAEIKESETQAKKIGSEIEKLNIEQGKIWNQIKELEKLDEEYNRLQLEITKLKEKEKNLGETRSKISELQTLNKSIQEKLETGDYAEEFQANLRRYQEIMKDLEDDARRYDSLKKVIEEYESKEVERKYLENKALADNRPEHKKQKKKSLDEIEKIKSNLETVEKTIADIEKALIKYGDPEAEQEAIQLKVTEIAEKLAGLSASMTGNLERIQEANNRVTIHEETLKRHRNNLIQSREYGLIRRWLEEAFIPSIQMIEQNVFQRLHSEFNRLFVKWFKTLLESEDIEGYIDEDFTPIIDQSGYELEIDSLSGGEKTSVALAYRLALNTIVKQVTHTMQNNLLILDEPTDGFSREQLYKMRDILQDLNCEQVIMVSHENELESVADHIYRVNKQGTVSTVQAP
ncbi:MAG: hypothetical protein ACTSYO_00255, partial [Candidatus Ranarchaeia archaeon]